MLSSYDLHMDTGKALDRLREVFPRGEIEHSDTIAKVASEYLDAFYIRIKDDEEYDFSEGEPAALFAMCESLRSAADRYERDLLRTLKWGAEGMTWEQVAEAVDGQLGGRQAMQKRWTRLTAATRRTTTGDMRRGAAQTSHRHDCNVDDTTTTTE
ncbi:hypothetical protein Ae505Ps2_6274c [Pseudonocardia sp. Ae505_Ps2]|nr:hypothetical protein Ae505Ps2_6274c [Pseudonocardia sp. Ae505_Ps2]